MRFSCDWLALYVDLADFAGGDRDSLPRAVDALARDLTSVGLSVEGIERFDTDVVLDVDVTGNRPDCMNHFGLAREIAVKRGLELRPPLHDLVEVAPRDATVPSVTIDDPEGCRRFVARVIRGVRIGPSPEWLVRRLKAIGLRSVNNVVDATNFCLWESGQPMHAYDLATIPGGALGVRRARPGETLTTLDGEKRELDPEILVIADVERAVGLAGIMGGLETEVTAATTDVLLESAHFDRRRVRIGAKRLGMHTDASHRFERGADSGLCDDASRRCAALIVELAGGEAEAGAVDARGAEPSTVHWRLAGPELERFAGVEVPDGEIERILGGLGFAPRRVDERLWEGEVPSFREVDFEPRRDRTAEREAWRQDLFEEVLRQYGLDRVPATLPRIGGIDEGENPEHDRRDRLRDLLAGFGYAESIQYAFGRRTADRDLPRLVGDGDPIALANPLSELYAVMRRSLVPGLVAAAEFNARRGATSVRLFESGHLFPGGGEPEVEALALVAGGVPGSPWDRQQSIDLLTLKGQIETVLEELGETASCTLCEMPGIRSGTGMALTKGEAQIGFLGELTRFDASFPLFAAELRLDRLEASMPRRLVQPPPRVPGIAVDLTLTHLLSVSWREIETAIAALGVADLVSYSLKDRYQGAGVPAGAVATTITFVYNAGERSLTQDAVNGRQEGVRAELERRFAVRREEMP
ncbi:MAG: phenylalanine--tRNA ligase subunit beta [Thermoanaerobaculia bacterium]